MWFVRASFHKENMLEDHEQRLHREPAFDEFLTLPDDKAKLVADWLIPLIEETEGRLRSRKAMDGRSWNCSS